jgi:hypothetical protein
MVHRPAYNRKSSGVFPPRSSNLKAVNNGGLLFCVACTGIFTQALYDEANKNAWTVISMKNDWKRIFAFD